MNTVAGNLKRLQRLDLSGIIHVNKWLWDDTARCLLCLAPVGERDDDSGRRLWRIFVSEGYATTLGCVAEQRAAWPPAFERDRPRGDHRNRLSGLCECPPVRRAAPGTELACCVGCQVRDHPRLLTTLELVSARSAAESGGRRAEERGEGRRGCVCSPSAPNVNV